MSIWSDNRQTAWNAVTPCNGLLKDCDKVLEHAARERVIIAFEPEPGMLIDTMTSYGKLLELVDFLCSN